MDADAAVKPGSDRWTVFSDRRLKQKIQPLQNPLEKLLGLHGVTFEWRNPQTGGGHVGPQMGLIADEVASVFPGWVGVGPGGYRTLTISGFEALTAEALRQLRTEDDREIEALQVRNAELRARVEKLESVLTQFDHPRQSGRGK